jgi:hypothetical protein
VYAIFEGEFVMDEIEQLRKDNTDLRSLLAHVCSSKLDTDDGELSDSSCCPVIDFKRMSVKQIEDCMHQRAAASVNIDLVLSRHERFI